MDELVCRVLQLSVETLNILEGLERPIFPITTIKAIPQVKVEERLIIGYINNNVGRFNG